MAKLEIRLTDAEKEVVEARASREGMSLSWWVRMRLLFEDDGEDEVASPMKKQAAKNKKPKVASSKEAAQ